MAESKRRAELHAVFDGSSVQVDATGTPVDLYTTATVAVAYMLCHFPGEPTKQEAEKFAGAVYAQIKRLKKRLKKE